jgi:hypothetical protein
VAAFLGVHNNCLVAKEIRHASDEPIRIIHVHLDVADELIGLLWLAIRFLRGDREERRQDFATWVLKQSPQLWAITGNETHLMQELPHRSLRRELAGELPEDEATVRILNVLQAAPRGHLRGQTATRSIGC